MTYTQYYQLIFFLFFFLIVMQASDSLRFQSLTQTLGPHYEGLANNIAQHTEQRRAEILKEKQSSTAVASWFLHGSVHLAAFFP